MAIKTTAGYQRPDYQLKLKQVESLLRQAKDVFNLLDRAERKIDGKYDYPSHQALRGNFLGNFLRGNKVSAINSNIDRSQQALLDFHANLVLFDERLANKISLPSKMSEFSSANGKTSDIAIRTNMRFKEFDVTKSKRSMQTIIRRLESEKKKALYEIAKEKELSEYIEDEYKGAIADPKKK
ncbi:hypothetical protein [uncultured Anaerococcus sp.]|uniref:hypothetical protein n=1 Tax=uncultured Anaerococcus sp. TaxID=293428 RepID=UPI00262F72AC|nr:hypothetical protein [uncultured Anaerococcus sp.]